MANADNTTTDNTGTENTDITVNQLGDVTERDTVVSPISGNLIPVTPMSKLPKKYAELAKSYPGAKGFTVEANTIALHF